MKPKLIVSFRHFTEEEFQAKAGFILVKMTGNAGFPEPWAPQVPTLLQLTEALADYRQRYIESATRDTLKIRARREARELVADMLQGIASYLELVSQGDLRMLETTGYDLRIDAARGGVGGSDLLDPPVDLRLSHGRVSGTVAVRVGPLRGAKSYEVELADSEGGAPGAWRHATTSTAGLRILLQGQSPGRHVWVRVRGVGSAGPGLWTEPARLMVV
jgi:hypothetical protein